MLPPLKLPTMESAIKFAPRKQIRKHIIEKIKIIFLAYLNINVFSFCLPKVLYSLVILLMASGIPADEIIKKKL